MRTACLALLLLLGLVSAAPARETPFTSVTAVALYKLDGPASIRRLCESRDAEWRFLAETVRDVSQGKYLAYVIATHRAACNLSLGVTRDQLKVLQNYLKKVPRTFATAEALFTLNLFLLTLE